MSKVFTVSEIACKGAWQLGSECGTCERCVSSAFAYIAELRAKLKPPPPDGKRSLAEVSAEIRDLTKRLNAVMSEAVAAHEMRIEIDIDHAHDAPTRDPIPRLRVEQYKRVD